MKTNTLTANRKSIVSNALGSVRVEGLEPSKRVMKDLDSFISGKKTIEQIIRETKERYVSLRRG
ncbi:antitoxin VbhA family protein [Polynucleobacter sp. 35-46-11]|uniref:antitoxin VbhA family protein n=1 Tax=Polynucleobacter sp. 35-46-11 TaxID=1970425 RepID=UPI0025DB597B|nr:antitoxin VbhA family protein [Polynucleobacter sp. 35-46-11]